MKKIKLAIAGVGNCASSLVQGIEYYKHVDAKDCIGLMHYEVNGYRLGDIEVVAAFDVDKRKVGKDLSEAVFAEPNCTAVFYRVLNFFLESLEFIFYFCKYLFNSGIKLSKSSFNFSVSTLFLHHS